MQTSKPHACHQRRREAPTSNSERIRERASNAEVSRHNHALPSRRSPAERGEGGCSKSKADSFRRLDGVSPYQAKIVSASRQNQQASRLRSPIGKSREACLPRRSLGVSGSAVQTFKTPTMALIAITRPVSSSINMCELSFHARQPIDVARATAQHKAYQDCLAELGAEIVSLPAAPELPDAVFVEDAAVVVDEVAIIPIMGAPSRRPEARTLIDTLSRYRPIEFLVEPATLDGGDVLRVGREIFVGVSGRTNRDGISQLRELLEPHNYRVRPIEMRQCLHLKSACSYIGRNTMLINRSWVDADHFREFELIDVPEEEPSAANALLVKDVVVMPGISQSPVPGFPSHTQGLGGSRRKVWHPCQTLSDFPKTRALLVKRGFRVKTIDLSELQKAEAGATCGCLIFDV
jgi:dimethylargininase